MQAKYEGVWMLSEGVRMVSGCVRQMSEVCRCHINWKKFDYCHTNYMRPLLPVPIFVQKRPHGRYFQGGVVGFISGSTANFFVLGGQVMDIGKQWGWCWRIFLTWPRYPPTLIRVCFVFCTNGDSNVICWGWNSSRYKWFDCLLRQLSPMQAI